MKTYLTLLAFIGIITKSSAQYSTKSTFICNEFNGLSVVDKETLDDVFFEMNEENYHCFELVSLYEKNNYPYSKQITLARQRAQLVQTYYIDEHNLDKETVFIKYGGQYPSLWLHKPSALLTTSGKIRLDEKYQQCYSYNSNQANTIYTDNGNKIFFEKFAFETTEGKTVTSNNVSICLWEFTDKKSLIYANLTTSCNGKMLETGGSFYIEASLNGKSLRLRTGNKFTIEIPTAKSYPDMFTYYGANKDGFVNWEVDKNEPVLANTEVEQVIYDEYGDVFAAENEIDGFYYQEEGDASIYQLSSGKLGWINCDRFYEVKNTSTLAIKVDSKEPVSVRLVFRNIDSVMPCYANSNHKNKYEASGIPTGEKVLVLAYHVEKDNAVLGYKEIVIGENSIEEIDLNNLSKSRFESAVRELLY